MEACVTCGARAVGQCKKCGRLFCGQHLITTGSYGYHEDQLERGLIDPRLSVPRNAREGLEVLDYVEANRLLLSDGRSLCVEHRNALVSATDPTVYRRLPEAHLAVDLPDDLAWFISSRVFAKQWSDMMRRFYTPREYETLADRLQKIACHAELARRCESGYRTALVTDVATTAATVVLVARALSVAPEPMKTGLRSTDDAWRVSPDLAVSDAGRWLTTKTRRLSTGGTDRWTEDRPTIGAVVAALGDAPRKQQLPSLDSVVRPARVDPNSRY